MKFIANKKRRAILLVTTLIFAVLLMIGVMSALGLSGRSLLRAENTEDAQAVLSAVEAGSQYALSRLQERPGWKGDGDGVTTSLTTVDRPDFVVIEDNGDVVGFIQTEAGTPAQFRIRFNFHDGDIAAASDADGLDDPTTITIGGPWISINNLNSGGETPVPRAEDTGGGIWRVQPASPMPYDAPAFTACILVEGKAGEGLRDQMNGPNPNPNMGSQTVATRVGEFYFRREAAAAADAVSYSAGTLDVNLADGGLFKVDTADPGKIPKIRSNENVDVSAILSGTVSYDGASSEVYVASGSSPGSFKVNGFDSTTPAAIERTTSQGEFLNLKWSDIKKAGTSADEVRAGTYIWRDSGGGAYLEYYNQEYDPVAGVYPPGSGTVMTTPGDVLLSGSSALNIDPANLMIEYLSDINVQPQGSVTGLAIVPDPAITTSGRRPVNEFIETGTQSPVLTASGDIAFKGRLTGVGSITSEGSLTFQGSSALETGSNDVALYAKGDIVLEAIPEEVVAAGGGGGSTSGSTSGCSGTCSGGSSGCSGTCSGGSSGCSGTCSGSSSGCSGTCSGSSSGSSGSSGGSSTGGLVNFPGPPSFQDQEFQGIIFTMGDFVADLKGPTYQGNLALRGVLAAYGGDPEAGEAPGASGKGYISITAENAAFVYDPAYIERILDLSSPTPLVTTFSTIF
jgi:hypothetical protein